MKKRARPVARATVNAAQGHSPRAGTLLSSAPSTRTLSITIPSPIGILGRRIWKFSSSGVIAATGWTTSRKGDQRGGSIHLSKDVDRTVGWVDFPITRLSIA